jgi:hypothetical protein
VAIRNRSEISTIDNPEFINLEPLDLNPLMSKCQIKVFHLGKNRNGSYIDKETADKMAKTLRGTPIVASWYEDKQDYGDHGHVMHIENGEVTFSCKTVPYGFVSPDAEVWYQNYIDYDEFGNALEHTYMLTTGYLWTGQFEELTKVITEGQPQSMELDSDSLQGHWAEDSNSNVEFFIINDATFSKLCILGSEVEPCMQGATVEPMRYSLEDNNFSNTLFSMMEELKDVLEYKGGSDMPEKLKSTGDIEEVIEAVEEAEVEESVEVEETEAEELVEVEETETEEVAETEAEEVEADDEPSDEFACGEKKKQYADKKDEETKEEKEETEDEDETVDEEKKKVETNHALQEEYEKLQNDFAVLQAEVESLREFKLGVENAQKDALINKYYMLSEEDKAEIIEHKAEYTCDEIEAKLAVLYVQKNDIFSSLEEEHDEVEEEVSTSFSLDEEVSGYAVSGMLEALRKTVK